MTKPSVRRTTKQSAARSFNSLDDTEIEALKKAGVSEHMLNQLSSKYDQRLFDPHRFRQVIEFFQRLPAERKLPKLVRDLTGIDERPVRTYRNLTAIPKELFDEWVGAGLSLSMLRLLGDAWAEIASPRRKTKENEIAKLADRAAEHGWTFQQLKKRLFPSRIPRDEKQKDLQICFARLAALLADLPSSEDKSKLRAVADEYTCGKPRKVNRLTVDQRNRLSAAVLEVATLPRPKARPVAKRKKA